MHDKKNWKGWQWNWRKSNKSHIRRSQLNIGLGARLYYLLSEKTMSEIFSSNFIFYQTLLFIISEKFRHFFNWEIVSRQKL